MVLAFSLVIARLHEIDTRLRWGWIFLALGALSIAFGMALDSFAPDTVDVNPATAQIPFLLYFPLTFIGLSLFTLVLVPRRERTILWLDLLILMISLTTISWYFFLAFPLPSLQQEIEIVYALAYPLGDFLLLASTVALIQRDIPLTSRRMLNLLVLSITFKVIADIISVYFLLVGITAVMAYLNILWLGSAQCELVSASIPIYSARVKTTALPSRFSPARHLFRLTLPYLAVVGGLGLLIFIVINTLSGNQRLVGVLYGVSALVLMVLLRQYMVLRENLDLYQQMKRLAITDNLTNVYNRHFFNETFPREMERARRYGKSLSIMILDLNDFKKYNDTFGHLRGDVILQTVAKIFASHLRSSDTIARFGGDEFVIILPETNRHRAKSVAERIQQAVASLLTAEMPLSVSIGIASYRQDVTPEQILDEADKDLYNQKAKYKQENLNRSEPQTEVKAD